MSVDQTHWVLQGWHLYAWVGILLFGIAVCALIMNKKGK